MIFNIPRILFSVQNDEYISKTTLRNIVNDDSHFTKIALKISTF